MFDSNHFSSQNRFHFLQIDSDVFFTPIYPLSIKVFTKSFFLLGNLVYFLQSGTITAYFIFRWLIPFHWKPWESVFFLLILFTLTEVKPKPVSLSSDKIWRFFSLTYPFQLKSFLNRCFLSLTSFTFKKVNPKLDILFLRY